MKNLARIRYAVTAGAVLLAIIGLVLLYKRYQTNPWTRDGQVRANIVGIAPRVAGPIINIPVIDNQPVKKGDLLFEIDPSTYQAALDEANAELLKAQAQALQAKQNLARMEELFVTKVIDEEEFQNSQDTYAAAAAEVAAAEAAVQTARLDLSYTKVFAPVDGYLTNVNVSPGTYVDAGQHLLALVDSSTFYVYGYFQETVISRIKPGDRATVTLMGHEFQPIEGVVKSVGWAIHLEDGATENLLPVVSPTVDWIRLAQRFPVRVEFAGEVPIPLRIGQTASISISPAKKKN